MLYKLVHFANKRVWRNQKESPAQPAVILFIMALSKQRGNAHGSTLKSHQSPCRARTHRAPILVWHSERANTCREPVPSVTLKEGQNVQGLSPSTVLREGQNIHGPSPSIVLGEDQNVQEGRKLSQAVKSKE